MNSPTIVRPASIDWGYLIERRTAVLQHAPDFPPYLLLPEVRALLASVHQANSRLLYSTLWHTGARISEALDLTRASFELDNQGAFVSLTTLKRRGRPRKGISRVPARRVPLRDPRYLDLVARYFATERPNADARLFPITRQAADARLRTIVRAYAAEHGALSIPISCHTFRHSFAVNCILHGRPLPILQGWLGHAHIESTVIYAQVLATETDHLMADVEF